MTEADRTDARSRKILLASLVVVLLGGLVFVWLVRGYQSRMNYRCNLCLSGYSISQHFVDLGPFGQYPITPEQKFHHDTTLYTEFMAPAHQHDWAFLGGVLTSGEHASGSPTDMAYTRFGLVLRDDPDLVAFLKSEIAAGRLTREEVVNLARCDQDSLDEFGKGNHWLDAFKAHRQTNTQRQ